MARRLRELRPWLKAHGITVEPGGKHFHAKRPGDRLFPLVCHNGERSEIESVYIKGLMRNFHIKESPEEWERREKRSAPPPAASENADESTPPATMASAREPDE